MEKIDSNKIQRILDIKNDFENETINSTIILPEYIECINTIYDTELKNQDEEINKIKLNIDKLYDNMQEIIDKLKNKEQ